MNDKPLVEIIDTAMHNAEETFMMTMDYLREGMEGKFDIPDPSNPFVFLMEASCQHSAGSVRAFESEIRKLFAIVADEPMDVYHHITDKNNLGLFALPAKARISFVFVESELRAKMVFDPDNNYRKIVIPANTRVTVAGVTFMLAYPVEIRELEHKHLQVVYDLSVPHPMHALSTNIINPTYSSTSTEREIAISPELIQYDIISLRETVSQSLSLDITTVTQDQFLAARVYIRDENGEWMEIRTTHSNYYYDPANPTTMIKVLGEEIRVSIPDYYIQTGMISGEVRADFYVTKGEITSLDLSSFNPDEFRTNFKPLDTRDPNVYSEALRTVSSSQVFSSSLVSGGRNALPFEEVRRRVIHNVTGDRAQPISPDDLEKTLSDRGYTITKQVDVLTNRLFLASRTLPTPKYPKLITPASLSMQTIVFNVDEANYSGSVIDNGTSFTIDPKTVFRISNGVSRFYSQRELESILSLPQDQRVMELNRLGLFYTPYHYVVDQSLPNDTDVRAYHLTNPEARNKLFIAENSRTRMSCSVRGYELTYKEDGYILRVSTESSESVKALTGDVMHAQLAFKPFGQTEFVHINGELEGRSPENEYVFAFHLKSNFNITKAGLLEFLNFTSSSGTPRIHRCQLEHPFDVFFATSTTMGGSWQPAEIDLNLGHHLLPNRIAGISQERITLEFGSDLDTLWTQSRVIAGAATYKTYEKDVIDVYPDDVVEMIVTPGQEPKFEITHKKGDPKLNPDGSEKILHPKGSVVVENGKPVLLSPRKVSHQVDILMMEAVYRFSNDEAAMEYRLDVERLVTSWIVNTLSGINPNLLEETRVFFYPETRSGAIPVVFDNSVRTEISAAQTLVVNLFVEKAVERDIELRTQLRTKGTAEISRYFNNLVISKGGIITLLENLYREAVIGIDVQGLGGGERDFKVMTILQDTDRLGIAKKLESRPDGKVLVVEDIQFNFIRHQYEENEN